MQGLISHIQRYATKDGPGLRTTVFMMGCNLRCAWCANPEAMLPGVKVLFNERKCQRCGCCVQAARPTGSIALTERSIEIDRTRCENLMNMVEECPYDAYERQGEWLEAEVLAQRLLRDKAFYDQSGGGVTFSGGEPMLQQRFLNKTMERLKCEGIHTALDTAGDWDFDTVRDVLVLADLVLLDIKAVDEQVHRRCTGISNARILNNARRLAAMNKPMLVRMVIVPGWNDRPDDINARLTFIRSLGHAVHQLDILKYHRLGEGKYRQLGLPYPLSGTPECRDEQAKQVLVQAEAMGIRATIDG